MSLKLKIALSVPCEEDPDRYFSFKLKQDHHIESAEYKPSQRILVISGIQGRFQSFRELLLQNGIIDEAYRWTFGNGHLVIAGNCFGDNEIGIECLWLIYALENRARIRGGYVHLILGENELNNFNGRWQHLHPKYANNQKTSRSPYVILYDGNSELKRWLKTKNVVEKIGALLISHMDVSNELSIYNPPLTYLNDMARLHLSGTNGTEPDPFMKRIFQEKNTNLLNTEYSGQSNTKKNKTITAKKIANATYIFTDNTGDTSDHNNSENLINVLLIRNNQFYQITPQGKRVKISFETLVSHHNL